MGKNITGVRIGLGLKGTIIIAITVHKSYGLRIESYAIRGYMELILHIWYEFDPNIVFWLTSTFVIIRDLPSTWFLLWNHWAYVAEIRLLSFLSQNT